MSETPGGFVAVARADDLPPGRMMRVVADRQRVLLANVAGTFHALQDMCGHRRAPLSEGELDGYLVICPLHDAFFDVRSGRFVTGPASADVPVYDVQVEAGTVYVRRRDG